MDTPWNMLFKKIQLNPSALLGDTFKFFPKLQDYSSNLYRDVTLKFVLKNRYCHARKLRSLLLSLITTAHNFSNYFEIKLTIFTWTWLLILKIVNFTTDLRYLLALNKFTTCENNSRQKVQIIQVHILSPDSKSQFWITWSLIFKL